MDFVFWKQILITWQNTIADSSALDLHARSILLEREIQLERGQFAVSKRQKLFRLENRISFLIRHFSGKEFDGLTYSWKGDLTNAITLRNELIHPRKTKTLTVEEVRRSLEAILSATNAIYLAVFKSGLPYKNFGTLPRKSLVF